MSEGLAAHLSAKSINDYRRRTMSPAELIIADDHLATCDVCYQRVSHSDDPEDMFVSVPTDALTAATGESGHLSYEQLASYVDGELDEVEREICDVHLQICKQCSDELRDLNVFKAAMSDSLGKDRRASSSPLSEKLVLFWRRPTRWSPLQFAGAATLAALVIAGIAWSVWTISRSRRTEITESTRRPTTSESPAPSVEGPIQSASPVASPQIALTLNDGGGQVTLDRDGNLSGLGDLSPLHQQAVRTALTTGRLGTPLELAELTKKAGVLMGGKAEGVSFALLGPVGTVVRTTRPTFHWQPLDGASAYFVNIYDSSFSKVATSPQLSAPQWTIPSSLRRGIAYLWQVTALRDGKEIKSPVQPAPEARFKILERAKADELERARRAYPNSHLLLGTLYAQAGLLDDAERELRALAAANPKSSVAQRLLHNVRTIR
jgi:hypothetical protein